jgi:cyclohexyl-isocyanide hydratase
VRLLIEYDPHPPFDAGSPDAAGPALTNAVLARRAPLPREARRLAMLAGQNGGG